MIYSVSLVSWLLATAFMAGFFGALLGVGGGIFNVPTSGAWFSLPLKILVAASIGSVIATANVGGSSYVDQRITNLHLAMFLEVFTTTGALSGQCAGTVPYMSGHVAGFCAMLGYIAYAAYSTRNLDDARMQTGEFALAKPDRIAR